MLLSLCRKMIKLQLVLNEEKYRGKNVERKELKTEKQKCKEICRNMSRNKCSVCFKTCFFFLYSHKEIMIENTNNRSPSFICGHILSRTISVVPNLLSGCRSLDSQATFLDPHLLIIKNIDHNL